MIGWRRVLLDVRMIGIIIKDLLMMMRGWQVFNIVKLRKEEVRLGKG